MALVHEPLDGSKHAGGVHLRLRDGIRWQRLDGLAREGIGERRAIGDMKREAGDRMAGGRGLMMICDRLRVDVDDVLARYSVLANRFV